MRCRGLSLKISGVLVQVWQMASKGVFHLSALNDQDRVYAGVAERYPKAAAVVPPRVIAVPSETAATAPTLRIGVLNDMSGPYRDVSGPTSVACVRQAIEDFGVSGKRVAVDVIMAEHQNKADVGAAIARRWLDQQGVDVIVDFPASAVALAVNTACREKNKVYGVVQNPSFLGYIRRAETAGL